MHKKILLVVFIMIISILTIVYIKKKSEDNKNSSGGIQKTQEDIGDIDNLSNKASDAPLSFVPLNDDETLIRCENIDFDNDGYEDQVNAIKTASNPNLQLLIGLYNPNTRTYERMGVIDTSVVQVKTFSYTGVDLTGEHKNALVYQGFSEDGSSILRAYFIAREGSNLKLDLIADLKSDGTIFIQQVERSESYILSESSGTSYPIWVYSSDPATPNSTDQIHSRYDWAASSYKYEVSEVRHITGNLLAAREMARIQDGTVETFANFLNGLWYMTGSRDTVYYLYFDYEGSQIIFMQNEVEEVYDWQRSNVRRNGIAISTTNLEIENLRRSIDITLRNIDEIYVRISDDVRMLLNESPEWNGSYKKLSYAMFRNEGAASVNKLLASPFIESLEKGPQWKSADGTVYVFENGSYTAHGDTVNEEGSYTAVQNSMEPFIQFRSSSTDSDISGICLVSNMALSEDPEDVNENTIILQPYYLSPLQSYPLERKTIMLTRYDPDESESTKLEEATEFTTGPGPKLAVVSSADPNMGRYFSPDNDGNEDILTMRLEFQTPYKITNWSVVVKDSRSGREFWRTSGQSMNASPNREETYTTNITWNGRGISGDLVTSAEDYPFTYTVTDDMGQTSSYDGVIPVDVLVVREGGRLKMQVPSIVFRGDAADFLMTGDKDQYGQTVEHSSITVEQRANNERVLSRIAQILRKFDTYKVTIVGHANPTNQWSGPESTNPEEIQDLIPLSRARAQYVKDWLVSQGRIASSRLSVEGRGGLETIADKNDLNTRWRNRRVEFILER